MLKGFLILIETNKDIGKRISDYLLLINSLSDIQSKTWC